MTTGASSLAATNFIIAIHDYAIPVTNETLSGMQNLGKAIDNLDIKNPDRTSIYYIKREQVSSANEQALIALYNALTDKTFIHKKSNGPATFTYTLLERASDDVKSRDLTDYLTSVVSGQVGS